MSGLLPFDTTRLSVEFPRKNCEKCQFYGFVYRRERRNFAAGSRVGPESASVRISQGRPQAQRKRPLLVLRLLTCNLGPKATTSENHSISIARTAAATSANVRSHGGPCGIAENAARDQTLMKHYAGGILFLHFSAENGRKNKHT